MNKAQDIINKLFEDAGRTHCIFTDFEGNPTSLKDYADIQEELRHNIRRNNDTRRIHKTII